MEVDHADILVVAAVAALAPVLADLSRRAKVPIVVVEIFLGIIVGPQVLGLADTDSFIEALSTFGLAFLFFLAGMEIDFERIRGAAGPRRASSAGAISLGLGLAIALVLHYRGGPRDDPRRACAQHDGDRHADADPARRRDPRSAVRRLRRRAPAPRASSARW